MAVLDNDFLIPDVFSYLGKGPNGYWFINTGESNTKLFQANSFKDRLMAGWYQAREDERLGRFRLPDVPDTVAYKGRYGGIRIVDETDGESFPYTKETRPAGAGWKKLHAAAFEHFYPELPKPWLDANPGEVWLVKPSEESEEFAVMDMMDGDFENYWDVYSEGDAKNWASGRRIWPEESE